jgi:hypothetical protein
MSSSVNTGLGIAVGAREIRAVLVRRDAIQWHGVSPISGAHHIAIALRDLLLTAPKLDRRTRLTVAVSPAWVQVKPLLGRPAVKPARLARQLLRENQRAFFLWKGSAAIIVESEPSKAAVWGAAFDEDVIGQVTQALRATRTAGRLAVPAVVAIVAALPNRPIVWSDDEHWFEIEGNRDEIRRVERISSRSLSGSPDLPAALGRLGEDATRFVDAYAAAVAPRQLVLSCQLRSDASAAPMWVRMRGVAAAIALSASIGFAAFGPAYRAARFTKTAERELDRNRLERLELARNESELRRVTQVLNHVESFRAQRGRVTRVLGELAESIPESTAILTFHVDSLEGAFTAIAPHVADVLPELVKARDIIGPRIVGSVTHEMIGGVAVERASFRFRRSLASVGAPRRAAQ